VPIASRSEAVSEDACEESWEDACDEVNEVAQQAAGSRAVRAIAASLGLNDELTKLLMPKPRRKPRTKSRPRSKARTPRKAPAQNQALAQDDSPELTSLERHARKCSICCHPERQSIDEAFLHWRSPQTIMHCFRIVSETTIYRHAHAFNFFARRNRNLQSALGHIIEDIDTRHFTGSEMLDAVRALAHLNDDGRWIHPASKSEVVYSMQRLPAGAGLPAGEGMPAAPELSTGQTSEPILIASRQLLENDANH
jgi:hypothetical protein